MHRLFGSLLLLVGCVRARATAIHPSGQDHANTGSAPSSTIARVRQVPERDDASTPGSFELGGMIALTARDDPARIHLAPGIRFFDSQLDKPLLGLALGAEYRGAIIETSLHIGRPTSDPAVIEQALDLFAGFTVHARSMSFAIGPSAGILAMPGGGSTLMLGIGVEVLRPYQW